jgi:hypothetical protein
MPSVFSKYKYGIAGSMGAAAILGIIAYIRRQQDIGEVVYKIDVASNHDHVVSLLFYTHSTTDIATPLLCQLAGALLFTTVHCSTHLASTMLKCQQLICCCYCCCC